MSLGNNQRAFGNHSWTALYLSMRIRFALVLIVSSLANFRYAEIQALEMSKRENAIHKTERNWQGMRTVHAATVSIKNIAHRSVPKLNSSLDWLSLPMGKTMRPVTADQPRSESVKEEEFLWSQHFLWSGMRISQMDLFEVGHSRNRPLLNWFCAIVLWDHPASWDLLVELSNNYWLM